MPRIRRRHRPSATRRLAPFALFALPLLLVLAIAPGRSAPAPTPSERPNGAAATAPFALTATLPTDCATGDAACLETAVGNLAYLEGPAAGMAAIRAGVEAYSPFGGVCHIAAHRVGAGTVARHNGDFGAAASELRGAVDAAFCGSGAVHGLLIELTARAGTADLVDLLRAACATTIVDSGAPVGDCAHGAGHAIVQARAWEIDEALADCNRLGTIAGETVDSVRECAIGAYMEVMQNGREVATADWVRAEDPTWPCPVAPSATADLCWGLVDIAAGIEGVPLEEVVALCATAPRATDRVSCRISIAEGATQRLPDLDAVEAFCLAYDDDDLRRDDCRLWAAAQIGGDRQHPEPAADLCRAIGDPLLRNDCFAAIGGKLSGQVGLAPCAELVDMRERRNCQRSLLPDRPGLP